jgi:flagellar hook-associated protein 1
MGVSFASYQVARSGLVVNERGLNVTGHNISNVNTAGYVRQQAMIKNASVQTTYTKGGMIQLGLGADIQDIRQIRHTFLDNVYRQENTTLGYWESRQKTVQDVEAVMAEPFEDSGLQSVLNQFWDSWQELAKEPDSLTVRALVRQRSESLVSKLNQMGTQLDQLQDDLNSEVQVRINEVNDITRQVADLNSTILKSEVNGDSANDYRDQRNLLLDNLTKLVDVDVNEMQDGQVDVTLGGYYLVQKAESTDLYAEEKNAGEIYYVAKLAGTDIEVPIKSGTIKGLMEARGEVSGAVGSYENGTPNTTADVVFYVDTSTMSEADVTTRSNEYTNELLKKGIDCNVTIQTATSAAGMAAAVGSTAGLRADANKYAVLLTNGTLSATAMETLKTALTNQGMDASVITDTPGDATIPGDWASLTGAMDGNTYSLTDFSSATASTYTTLTQGMADDTNKDVSDNISVVSDSLNIVTDMKKRLNALVNVMLREVNYIHKGGTTMKDPATQGEDLFVTINSGRPLEMGNIQLNSNLSDLSNIAASKTGSSGDNANALEIANLRNESLIDDTTGTLSLDDYYQAIILYMGNTGADATNITDSQLKLVQSADASRTAITGVSMDEEMTNMMKFKYAYNASARTLNVIDAMMETIVNRLGIVGR